MQQLHALPSDKTVAIPILAGAAAILRQIRTLLPPVALASCVVAAAAAARAVKRGVILLHALAVFVVVAFPLLAEAVSLVDPPPLLRPVTPSFLVVAPFAAVGALIFRLLHAMAMPESVAFPIPACALAVLFEPVPALVPVVLDGVALASVPVTVTATRRAFPTTAQELPACDSQHLRTLHTCFGLVHRRRERNEAEQ